MMNNQSFGAQKYDARICTSLGWFGLHSVFEHSLNLVYSPEAGKVQPETPILLTLTHQGADLQPYLIVLRDADFFMCKDLMLQHMKMGSMDVGSIRNTSAALTSSFLHISLPENKQWHAKNLIPQTFSETQQILVADFLRNQIAQIQPAIWHHAYQQIVKLFHRYQAANDVCALEAMLGMGIGLTPSGDDFLMGFFAALHANHKVKEVDLMQYLVGKSHQATTVISQHFLQNAMEGYFSQALIEFNQLDQSTNAEQFLQKLMKMVQKGATSGLDTALGYFSGITGQTL